MKKSVMIVDDDRNTAGALAGRFISLCEDIYFFEAYDDESAKEGFEHALDQDRELSLIIVDQVDGTLAEVAAEPERRQWGFKILRHYKENYPEVTRVLYSAQSERIEIQNCLEEGLVDHFEVKTRRSAEEFCSRILEILSGERLGNCVKSGAEANWIREMREFLSKLPDGEDTVLKGLSGKTMTAKELVNDVDELRRFRRAFLFGGRMVLSEENAIDEKNR